VVPEAVYSGFGLVGFMKEVRPTLGPLVIHFGSCSSELMKSWMLSHVGCSLAYGSMNPSEANLNLWIKPTLFPRSRSFLVVLPGVTEAWWHIWMCWEGAAGPSDAAGPASWPLCNSPVVCLLDPK
jgi:hypothetical protein